MSSRPKKRRDMGCEYHNSCSNSLTTLGKLLTTHMNPLEPGVNRFFAKKIIYTALPGIFVIAAKVYALKGVDIVK